jgi:pyruvate/2-oxoglutarate dehydrogenase complex dihydrolipoamide dehydrogenase (E3) component
MSKPSEMVEFDVLLLGAGQASVPLAGKLLDAGKSVALVERKHVGGSCVNFGCTPTKAGHATTDTLARLRKAGELGLKLGDIGVDVATAMNRVRAVAAKSRDGLRERFEGFMEKGRPFRLIDGHGRLAGRVGERFACQIGDLRITARHVVIDVGTRTLRPPIDGLDDVPPDRLITGGNWLDRDDVPETMTMVGGGVIALEGGQFYGRLGSRVTVVESGDQIAKTEDKDVADALQKVLEDEGMAFELNAKASRIESHGDGLRLTLDHAGGGQKTLDAAAVYLSPGRRPNTDDCGLDTLDLAVTDKGMIECDVHLRTSVDGIWAAGDVAHKKQFTNNANDDQYLLLPQLTGRSTGRSMKHRSVPYAIFTDPPLARCGLSEKDARAAGHDVVTVTYDAESNGRHYQMARTIGHIKLVGDRRTGKLLGAACFLDGGDDLAQLYHLLLAQGGDLEPFVNLLPIHPTRTEAALSAAKKLQEKLAVAPPSA